MRERIAELSKTCLIHCHIRRAYANRNGCLTWRPSHAHTDCYCSYEALLIWKLRPSGRIILLGGQLNAERFWSYWMKASMTAATRLGPFSNNHGICLTSVDNHNKPQLSFAIPVMPTTVFTRLPCYSQPSLVCCA